MVATPNVTMVRIGVAAATAQKPNRAADARTPSQGSVGVTDTQQAVLVGRSMLSVMKPAVRHGLLALSVLLIAHQAASMVSHGGQAALVTKHDWYGLAVGLLALSIVCCAMGVGLIRWVQLRSRLQAAGPRHHTQTVIDWRSFLRDVVRMTPRLAVMALAMFLLQESFEQDLGHASASGLHAVFGDGHLATLPLFLLVSSVVAAVAALLRLGLAVLAGFIKKRATPRPDARPILPTSMGFPLHRWLRFPPDLGRAPPLRAGLSF